MKNKTRRLAAFLLSAAVVITAVPGMQERVYAQKTGGYTESPKSENVPVVKETKIQAEKGRSSAVRLYEQVVGTYDPLSWRA